MAVEGSSNAFKVTAREIQKVTDLSNCPRTTYFLIASSFRLMVLIVASFRLKLLPQDVEPSPFLRWSKISILVSKEIPFLLSFGVVVFDILLSQQLI